MCSDINHRFNLPADFGARVLDRLKNEMVIWLTTVNKDGIPQPNPVWFLWEGESGTIIIYTQPKSYKVRNLKNNSHVALHFNSTLDGGDIAIISGEAEIVLNAPRAHENPAYLDKYREGISDINLSPESMGQAYSIPIRVKLTKVRGFI